MKEAVFDLFTAAVVVAVAATTLLVVGLAGSAAQPSAVVAPAHLCPPMC